MSKKVCILSTITNSILDGSFIDCLDLYYNIREYIDTDYYILLPPEHTLLFLHKLKSIFTIELYNNILKHIYPYNFPIDYSLYNLFIYRYNYYLTNPDIAKFNSILINSWTAMQELIYNRNNIFIRFKNVISTPFILNYDRSRRYFIDYHKLSKYRLDNIMHNNILCNTFSNYDEYQELKVTKNFNVHNYSGLTYARHKHDNTDFYMEMKGKLIFEFLYFNKPVHYSPIHKYFNDGLTDYLSLFNIDDNIEQDLHISSSHIYHNLVKFTKHDKLVSFIKSC